MDIIKLLGKVGVFAIAFFTYLITCSIGWAATYYIDARNGNDVSDGLSEAKPWKTIAKVNTSSFNPGDQILFKRGEMWREQLNLPSSGSPGNPITFGTYGTGPKPIINGSNLVATGKSWTPVTPTIWTASIATEPKVVFFDGMKGTKVASQKDCTNTRNWHWAANVLSVYSVTTPETVYTSPGIEVGARDYAVWIEKNYVTFDGLHATKANSTNFALYAGSPTNIIIQNCEVSWAFGHGIGVSLAPASDNLFYANSIHDNEMSGIFLYKHSGSTAHENYIRSNMIYNNARSGNEMGIYVWANYYVIENNTVYNNGNITGGCNGIEVFNGDNDGYGQHVTVRYNNVYGQISGIDDGTGIAADDFSRFVDIYYNVLHDNDGPGIGVWRSRDINIYNNTCYANNVNSSGTRTSLAEVAVGAINPGEVRNIVIKNNIGFAKRTNTYAIRLDPNAYNSFGLNITNNDWYASTVQWYFWNTSGGSNLSTWNAFPAIGTDLNSDPLMTEPVNGNFSLKQASPCRDAGTNVGLSRDYKGNPIAKAPDIGAFEYQAPAEPTNLTISP